MCAIFIGVLIQWKELYLLPIMAWGLGFSISETFIRFRNYQVVGPIISFSKHGVIDHRGRNPKVFRWEEIDYISWGKYYTKSDTGYLLTIKLKESSKGLKLARLFLYQPFEVHDSHISNYFVADAERLLRGSVPEDKLRLLF